MPLFATAPQARTQPPGADLLRRAEEARLSRRAPRAFTPVVDERTIEVFRRAANPEDPYELRDLWLGRVEHELGAGCRRPHLAERWRASRPLRPVAADEVLSSRAGIRMVKELFNWFFREDIYGDLRDDVRLLLSSGSVDEEHWGLPETLKDCLRYALDRDWYGYSDSCGRFPAREAVAAYESERIRGGGYTARNVALTMGGTFAMSSLADFVLGTSREQAAPALCAIPNYPPLVESVARRAPVSLVPLTSCDGELMLDPLIEALTPQTPFVLLQTVANPTGAAVSEAALERLVRAAAPTTLIILDECHEWLGQVPEFSALRAASNVVRVSSLSKSWSSPGLKVGWLLADEQFVADYYEYASTTFGGPPSFFYTTVEVLARMERWAITGVDRLGLGELAEFEGSYGLDLPRLQAAYRAYCQDRRLREEVLLAQRDAVSEEFARSAAVMPAKCSINMLLEFDGVNDSYLCSRRLVQNSGIATYPGILNFGFGSGAVRITTARPWEDLLAASSRLATDLGPRPAVVVGG